MKWKRASCCFFVNPSSKRDTLFMNKEFKQYKRSNIAEMRPYEVGELLPLVSISKADIDNGSPKAGDMIARNPNNHADQWLVAEEYFKENFVPSSSPTATAEEQEILLKFLGWYDGDLGVLKDHNLLIHEYFTERKK